MSWFSFLSASSNDTALPDIFPMPVNSIDFVNIDVQNIYARILTEVLERTHGIKDEYSRLLWDNCSASEAQDGIVTLVAKAMANQKDLFIVFDRVTNVVRKATVDEENIIRADYKKKAESSTGVYITFKNYDRSKMVRFYSELEYCTVNGLYKSQNLSHAIQLKMKGMRGAIGESDSVGAITQAKAIAEGLKAGKSVMIDGDDTIETSKPDLTATQSTMEFIAHKQSFYLGLPASWILGIQSKSMSDSGKADSKAVERGLRPYFFSIVKPVIDAVFGIKVEYKKDDNDDLGTANETLKTFEISSNELISHDNKLKLINKLYGLPDDSKGDAPEKPVVDPNAVNNSVPAKNPAPSTNQV